MPHATEIEQWGGLVYKIGAKVFAVLALEPDAKSCLSFKCTTEQFAELVEREGVIQAPYFARGQWVGLERLDALPRRELDQLLQTAYELIRDKLPAKVRKDLAAG